MTNPLDSQGRGVAVFLTLVTLGTLPLNAQWIAQSSGTTEHLNDVAVLDSVTAVAVGNNGIILKTTNAGTTWTPKASGTVRHLRSTAFISPTGYAVGDRVICHSSDKGESWQADSSSHSFSVVAYGPIPNFDVYMGTESGTIRFKLSGIPLWRERVVQGEIVGVGLRMFVLQGTLATVATFNSFASFSYSTVNGNFWDSVGVPLMPWDFVTSGDLHSYVQYLVGLGGNPPMPFLMQRWDTSASASWNRLAGPPWGFGPLDVRSSFDGRKVHVCGGGGIIFYSPDFGTTWTQQHGGSNLPALRAMAFSVYNENLGYAVGDSGIILFTSSGGVTSAGSGESVIPQETILHQNYPNPFNPNTNIKYQISNTSAATLKVFDVLGREVATLVDEEKQRGTYIVQWDGSGFASGIYICRLIADDQILTRKLMLLR